jgi:ribonuclease P protein subunit RPR2
VKTNEFRKIAMERVELLLAQAEEVFDKRQDLANRYVGLVWKIKTKYNLRLPKELKRRFCKKCLSFWRPGATCRVRKVRGRVNVTCLNCGRVFRFPHPKRGK